ncbi:TPA: hypothetical protein N0F65_005266 [Lagenidium giganteum]|uniref:Reverse transcriptase domain-containing protein n=1 Tax=Lagenidium giganteum TaxID=4803 RepID=A0AAV2YXT8_9STRA|nr:TPA: hypothetical protein N0F65_005266 [Lagenidium giganteum]
MDRLGNDLYSAHAHVLVPILTKVFQAVRMTGITPCPFQQACVVALPKLASPRSGLDFRPISLLNSDYKIFARVFALRLHIYLPRLVSDIQFGFVKGWSIHDAIGLVQAALDPVPATRLREATVLLLDIDKAYDIVDCRYLLKVLTWIGFPTRFIRMVHALHRHTTAPFQVNGRVPAPFEVTRGIR